MNQSCLEIKTVSIIDFAILLNFQNTSEIYENCCFLNSECYACWKDMRPIKKEATCWSINLIGIYFDNSDPLFTKLSITVIKKLQYFYLTVNAKIWCFWADELFQRTFSIDLIFGIWNAVISSRKVWEIIWCGKDPIVKFPQLLEDY